MALVALFVLILSYSETTAAPIAIAPAVQAISPIVFSTFMSGVKSLFGSGNSFSDQYGFNYKNVYNTQLMMQTLNAFNNQRQKEEEIKQTELLHEDLDTERYYFHILIGCVILISLANAINTVIMLRKICKDRINRSNSKAVESFEKNMELQQLRDRAERTMIIA